MIEVKNRRIYISVPYDKKDTFKLIGGYKWHSGDEWSIPVRSRHRLYDFFPKTKPLVEPLVTSYLSKCKDIFKAKQKNLDEKLLDYSFKRKPFPHQKKMMKLAAVHEQYAFFTEMGTGKSQALVNTVDYLISTGLATNALIICPKTIIQNWGDEIEINSELVPVQLVGTRAKRLKIMENTAHLDRHISIINFEGVLSLKDCKLWSEYGIIIVDESSKIKNPDAKITKLLLKKFKDVRFKYIASGTPLQDPLDIYTQMKFLNEQFLGFQSFYSFRNHHAEMGGFGGYEILSYKNLEELKATLVKHSIQLKKEQCVDLPKKLYTKRILTMTGEVQKQYKEMAQDLAMEFGDGDFVVAPIILTKLLRLQEITSGVYLKDQSKNPKLQEVMNLIDENVGDTQIIIWCRFIKSIDVLRQGLEAKGISYSMIRGDVKDRQGEINKFQAGENRVFIGQISTGGMGITLTAGNMVIYYENTFSLAERKQSEDRAHRIGQKSNVTYIDIGYDKSVDIDIIKSIAKRQDVAVYLVNSFKKGVYDG